MRRRLPSLNALRAFEASARNISFTDAAKELNVTQGAISRQVKALEGEIGVALFGRSVRRIDLTREGQILYEGVRSALDQLEQAVSRVDRRKANGVLTVSALPTFAMNWLMPRLEDFSTRNQTVEVHLLTGIGAVDFASDDIDVAIRVGRLGGDEEAENAARIDLKMTEGRGDWRAHWLMADELVAIAAPELVRQNPPIETPRDLLAHRLLHLATREYAWNDYFAALGVTDEVLPDGPKFGHYFMVLAAARRGDGIAVVPRVLAEEDLATGRLLPVLSHTVPSAGSYYLLCRAHQWNLPAIKAFRTWISRHAESSARSQLLSPSHGDRAPA